MLQFVVGLGDKVSPTDIEEGMRVGYVNSSSQPEHVPELLVMFISTIL